MVLHCPALVNPYFQFFQSLLHLQAVYQFPQYDFLRRVPDAVHLLNPKHLVLRLEFFRHSLLLNHLPGQQFHPLLRLLLNGQKMLFQLPFQQKPGVNPLLVFL